VYWVKTSTGEKNLRNNPGGGKVGSGKDVKTQGGTAEVVLRLGGSGEKKSGKMGVPPRHSGSEPKQLFLKPTFGEHSQQRETGKRIKGKEGQ